MIAGAMGLSTIAVSPADHLDNDPLERPIVEVMTPGLCSGPRGVPVRTQSSRRIFWRELPLIGGLDHSRLSSETRLHSPESDQRARCECNRLLTTVTSVLPVIRQLSIRRSVTSACTRLRGPE